MEEFYRCGICTLRVGRKCATCDCCKWYVHFECSKTSYKKVCELKKSKGFICTKCSESTDAETCDHCRLLATSHCTGAQSTSMEVEDLEGGDALTATEDAVSRSMDVEELDGDTLTVRSTESTGNTQSTLMNAEELEGGDALTDTGDVPSRSMDVEDTALPVHSFDEEDSEGRFTLAIFKDKTQDISSTSLEILPEVPEVQTNKRMGKRSCNNGSLKRVKSTFNVKRFQVKQQKKPKIVDRRCLESSSCDENDSAEDDEAESEGTLLEAPYEYLTESGKAIGTVEIVKTSPDEVVHGRPLAQDEKKVVVKNVYPHGSTEVDEFVEGAFLTVNKIQLRKLCFKKKSTSKKKGRGHKVGASPRKWKKAERKLSRNSGEAYVSTSGKLVPKKALDMKFKCECKYTQCKEVTEDIRKAEHTAFWKLGDLEAQSQYILSKITSKEKCTAKKTAHGKVSKPKEKRRMYMIAGHTVCKELFKGVYNQSNGRLSRLFKFLDINPVTIKKDGRGGKTKEVKPIVVEKIIYVLKKLPKYISHYERENNPDDNNVYLEPGLTWTKVYELVKEEVGDAVEEKDFPRPSWFFHKVKTLFPHVKVHTPTKDKCNTCSILTLQEKLAEREEHQENAAAFREQMKKDKGVNCIAFDLQQVQPLPFIKENKAFYNRKTWLYNLGVNINDKPYFFLWTEVTASRGAREVASCVYKLYTERILDAETVYNQLIEWSDSCGGQNRNFIQVCMRLRLLNEYPNIKSLLHRFPASGHSYLSCDGDFGDIEKAKRKKDSIYTVQQYEEVMMSSKTKKNKPVIIRMQPEDFLDFTKGINFQNLSTPVDTDCNQFNWLKIHEFKYEENLFGFKFKYNLEDEYRTCYFGKKPKSRSNRPNEPVFTEMHVLYPNGRKLKALKVLDMCTLLDFVPAVYQDWYKKIIKSHEKIVAEYKKKKKNKTNEEKDDEEKDDECEILF